MIFVSIIQILLNNIMKLKITLSVPSNSDLIILRTIEESDIIDLMNWKNNNKEYFFSKYDITWEKQLLWYQGYIQRGTDLMFVVEANKVVIGCMGIRRINDEWDVYNVILGRTEYSGNGIMYKCFQKMLRYVLDIDHLPITLKVLKNNPAVGWYEKNGFKIIKEELHHFEMVFQSKF